ncbi:MAG: ATP-dependent DNA helicase, partial [Gammaproteobacteria bacterium]
YFARRTGLQERQEHSWPSPFQYQEQCLLLVPESMPEPASDAYAEAVAQVAAQVVLASQGRAFLLFTSHRMMRDVRQRLSLLIDFPMLVQGDAPRTELLQRFRSLGDAVLLGTASFWEGVDVRGDALSCVLIDKLPFIPPDDPMLRARGRVLRKEGGEPFRELQLPQAALALRQGAGRLIRDESDRGVLVLCDPRILGRSYGKVFLRSLPEMPLTRDMDDVYRFFGKATDNLAESETGQGESRSDARRATVS